MPRSLFDDPPFAGWGGANGRMTDAENRAKYLGRRLPEVKRKRAAHPGPPGWAAVIACDENGRQGDRCA